MYVCMYDMQIHDIVLAISRNITLSDFVISLSKTIKMRLKLSSRCVTSFYYLVSHSHFAFSAHRYPKRD